MLSAGAEMKYLKEYAAAADLPCEHLLAIGLSTTFEGLCFKKGQKRSSTRGPLNPTRWYDWTPT